MYPVSTGRWTMAGPHYLFVYPGFFEGLARARFSYQRHIFVDYFGKIVFGEEEYYKNLRDFYNGIAFVQYKSDNKWRPIRRTDGKVAYEEAFLDVWGFSEGLSLVEFEDGSWGHITSKIESISKQRYEEAGEFHEGLAWVKPKHEYYKYIKLDGSLAFDEYFLQANDFHNGRAFVCGKYGINHIINVEGKRVDYD